MNVVIKLSDVYFLLRLFANSFQAFAWFSDLLVEHAEIFWSLFAVDMDAVLEMQPPDTWDSFPLFQLLNDYLRTNGRLNESAIFDGNQFGYCHSLRKILHTEFFFYLKLLIILPLGWEFCYCIFSFLESLCGGKFHNHLRDVFAPQVVRYVDLMESSIAQSIHKGFERETWKPQG